MKTIRYASHAAHANAHDHRVRFVIGSVIVGMGTAMVYGALPTMIMRAVPVTETASANGLNVLLRSIGTTSASAIIAAVTSSCPRTV